MRMCRPVSDEPYRRFKQFSKGHWICLALKKGKKTVNLSSSHRSLWKRAKRLEARGYRLIWKMNDPGYYL